MKKILVIGAAGMIGRKLVARLKKDGAGELIQQDVVPFDGGIVSDLSKPGEAEKLIIKRPDLVFHLAAVVSGEAEADFEKGYRVNLDGTRYLFEAIRKVGEGYRPKVVFTSSIAVFGAPFPEAIGDEFLNAPLTSYGTQKAISELLVKDYSRKSFVVGRALRLPTVVVRPGRPNRAASTFASSMIREPLAGRAGICPGTSRPPQLPGFSVEVGETAASVSRAGGEEASARIRWVPEPIISLACFTRERFLQRV